ncbi:MAG: dihydropteroate synthase [Gammaproteobacteria bacterium]|nr:dihydropteroate synthase [Rhodocyclaceae bacterium]MBU3908827.1 dihydropteroate synthase [Gammaproteobacteria bacterium]MBU3987694.1 dihydropteroate synthase [Gammaproteobacteria bacterium]MBU4003662.1 dihydropteroate synthase [Gammaproteobacteria bacterium]MBU4021776.1 dihydropteroate synthase [Gammaproteobacteria bacterium]
MTLLHCGSFRLSLARPLIMGIVNLTPDSFSGDGVGDSAAAGIAHAAAQRDAGADMLDLGAESSRPGAAPVPAEVEIARLLLVLHAVRDWGLPISVDTAKPEVMRAAIDAGAAMINDILALQATGALAVVAASDAAVCLMHMQGEPRTMQANPQYADVTGEVRDFLAARVAACMAAGIPRERLLIDPGFGFGKTVDHNYTLLRELPRFNDLGVPMLAGLSRKSMLGAVTGQPNGVARIHASVAAAVLAVERGAKIVRVHDVAATKDALAVLSATEHGTKGE